MNQMTCKLAAIPLLMTGVFAHAGPDSIVPVNIPASFGVGASSTNIEGWIANNQQDQIRNHAWVIWGGLNAPSGQNYNNAALPVWETWAGSEEVFALQQALLNSRPTPARSFVKPHQFGHLARLSGKKLSDNPQSDAQVVSFNKFSPGAATFIKTPQTVPGIAQLVTLNNVAALNTAWPQNTPTTNRTINDFPIDATVLKPVFGVVNGKGITVLPYWPGKTRGGTTNPTNPTSDTWTTCAIVDPAATNAQPIPPTASQIAAAKAIVAANPKTYACKSYPYYVGLGSLYNFSLSAEEAAAFNKAQGGTAVAGDFAVLQAMHVTTKEISFWTWQTFWWQPGADTVGNYPGSKSGMPATLPAPYNNYAMCTAYSQTTPANGKKMTLCFNPHLETSSSIPDGIHSNCMSCHGLAGVGKGPTYPANYKKPINFFSDLSYYTSQSTRTDFSWAVANNQKP